MSLLLQYSPFLGCNKRRSLWNSRLSLVPEFKDSRSWTTPRSTTLSAIRFVEAKERIVKLLQKPELSVSPYDTAWVAMAPSLHSPHKPLFPECLNWLLENQCPDGSWARPHHHHLLQKDVLSNTLASVLALRKWGLGEDQIQRGIHFVESNFASACDDDQISPLGFEIIFPAMLQHSRELFLSLDLEQTALNALLHKRDLELHETSKSAEKEAYMVYLAEGMGKPIDWSRLSKYQQRNGSLFSCPSATAAAFIGHPNTGCLNYLQSVVKEFGNAASHRYPFETYCKMYTVDIIESLGISRFFRKEIHDVMEEAYSGWLHGDEDIFMEPSTCALAFRLLRMHGYSVASDQVTRAIQDWFSSSVKDVNTALELYKASELVILPEEAQLEKESLRLRYFLEQKVSSGSLYSVHLCRDIDQEVEYALQNPFYTVLDGITRRISIENYKLTSTRILKTSYWSPNFGCKEFLTMSLEDFNRCQQMHQEEVKALESWVMDNKLDELKFARQKCAYCYFSAAASIFAPDLSDARLSWAKNAVLTTVVDDFFDIGGSMEELESLIHLVEVYAASLSLEATSSRWDADAEAQFCSQNVKIIFSALKRTIHEVGDKGSERQHRPVTNHVVKIWLDLLHSMKKEAEWAKEKAIPSLDDYLENACTSFALGPIILPALYLLGRILSEEIEQHPEYLSLFKSMSSCGRLLNDIRSCDREMEQGKKLNAVYLYMLKDGGNVNKDSAMEFIKSLIKTERMELLRIVFDKRSPIPTPCKEMFLHMMKVVHLFYSKDDGFTSEDMLKAVKQIIHEPIIVLETTELLTLGRKG